MTEGIPSREPSPRILPGRKRQRTTCRSPLPLRRRRTRQSPSTRMEAACLGRSGTFSMTSDACPPQRTPPGPGLAGRAPRLEHAPRIEPAAPSQTARWAWPLVLGALTSGVSSCLSSSALASLAALAFICGGRRGDGAWASQATPACVLFLNLDSRMRAPGKHTRATGTATTTPAALFGAWRSCTSKLPGRRAGSLPGSAASPGR